MQKICLLLVAFATTIIKAAEVENNVLILKDDNFDDELAKYDNLLVEFYAPWCGHCKRLEPEYSAAAEVLSKNDPPITLAKVDATAEKKLAERFGIQGFPTLYWFKNGNKMEYTGGRTKDTIVSWVMKKSGPPSAELSCAALKEKLSDESTKFVLGYFGDDSSILYKEAHIPFAEKEDKIAFVHSKDANCAQEYGVKTPGVVFFRKFEETQVPYTGPADLDALTNWVKPLMVPTVFEFTEEEIDAIFGQQQPTLFLFRDNADKDAAFMKVYEEAAKANKGKMLFAYSGVGEGIQERLAEFMGVTKESLPVLRAVLPADMKKYECATKPADLTVEKVTKFVEDVKSGAIKPHLKSEEPVANDGPLTVVVGKNFEEIVLDKNKDVFVKFYAPWCGHCKKLAPVWEKLAEEFKDNADLLIAKFDATANEVEGLEIRGYPTLKFYPKGGRDPVDYDGERELDALKKWLEENSEALKNSHVHEDL